jgi:hypothetical protein
MSVELLEKVRGVKGTRRGRVFRENIDLKTLPPSTITENEATIRGVVSDFFAPAFFDDSVDIFFAYYETGNEQNTTEISVGTFSENVSDEIVSTEITGLTRNTGYRFFLFGEIDGARITSKARTFRTGAFAIETIEVNNIQEEQATFVGELDQFQGLAFEQSGPFDVISETNSGLVTFENQQDSESPLFVLDSFSNDEVRTSVDTRNGILDVRTTVDSVVSVSENVDIDIQNSKGFFTFSQESFDFQTDISREINAGFEYKKTSETGFKDVNSNPPPSEAGDFFDSTVTLDPNSNYEFRAFGSIGSFERVRGDLIDFSTLEKEIVDLITGESESVGVTSATVNGEVTNIEPEGRQVSVGFQYGAASIDANKSDLQVTDTDITYSNDLTGLEAGTTYVYRAYAEGSTDTFVGQTKSFQTEALIIETLSQSSSEDASKKPTEGSAYLFGRIDELNPDSSGADAEFRLGKEEPLTQTVNAGTQVEGDFDVNVSSLDAGEEYKYKLIAIDPETGITDEGSIETFTTVDLAVETEEADPIGRTDATFNGFITTLESGGSHDVYFEYREQGASTFTQTSEQELTTQTGFSENVTGLAEGTVYEFRAVIEKNTATERGELREFQTDAVEINTLDATGVDAGEAILNGELTFVGSEINDIEVFFYIREQGETARRKVVASQSPVSSAEDFSVVVDGLDPNRTYEFQAGADPDIKREQTGDFKTFTTKDLQVETANIPIKRTTSRLFLEGELTVYGGGFSSPNDRILAHQTLGKLSDGEATIGIQYTRAGSGDIENGDIVISDQSPITQLQTFKTEVEGLLEGTKYDVRAFADVGGTRVFGKIQRVSTKLND